MFTYFSFLIYILCFAAGCFVWGIITAPLGGLVTWLLVILAKEIKKNKEKNKEEEKRMAEELRKSEERRKAEELRKAEEMRMAEEMRLRFLEIQQIGFWNFIYRGIPTTNKNDSEKILAEIVKHPIIIDTNIWMDSDLDCFWQDIYMQCFKQKQRIIVPSSVYDEIIRLKKDNPSVEQIHMARLGFMPHEGKGFKARLALKRIKMFSDADLLDTNIKKVSNPYAYADVDIINLCERLQNEANTKKFSLITNDKDLIIRTRHILNEQKTVGEAETCRIVSVGYTKYTKYWNEYKSMQT